MQIILLLDSVAPTTILFWSPDCLTPIGLPSWMAAIFKYGGREQFSKFLYNFDFNFWNPPFYNMAARAFFLNTAAIFKL